MLIYKILNKINGKAYIGQTVQTLNERLRHHLSSASGCRALKSAIKKYGFENFEVQELAKADTLERLCELEIKLIQELNTLAPNGYNLKTGGDRPIYSEESRKRMSQYRKGRKVSISEKERTVRSERARKLNLGKKFSEEHLRKLSDSHVGINSGKKHPMYGKTHTKEALKKISQTQKGRTPWNKGKKTDASVVARSAAAKTRTYLVKDGSGVVHPLSGLKEVSRFTGVPFGTLCGRIPKIGCKQFGIFLIGIE